MEPPFAPTVTGLDSILFDLQRQGHRVLLAHPERCQAFHRDPRMLESLVGAGILTSITAGSLVGSFGGEARRFALSLARDGLIHNVASDTHDTVRRPPGTPPSYGRPAWSRRRVAHRAGARRDPQREEIPPRPVVELPEASSRRERRGGDGGLERQS